MREPGDAPEQRPVLRRRPAPAAGLQDHGRHALAAAQQMEPPAADVDHLARRVHGVGLSITSAHLPNVAGGQ